MDIEIYCDESRPDLLSSKKPTAKFMVIGSLWLASENRQRFKQAIHELRNRHRIGGEFKWQKVSPSRIDFFKELVDLFYQQGEDLRFRGVAVDHSKVNLIKYHENDQELGFYKFYYQLLHHWIEDFNCYSVFCDFKTNRYRDRLHVLKRCLDHSNLAAVIKCVQSIRSRESVLIQLSDVLIGLVCAGLNGSLQENSAKSELLRYFETKLGRTIGHTLKTEQKFNVFVMNLREAW